MQIFDWFAYLFLFTDTVWTIYLLQFHFCSVYLKKSQRVATDGNHLLKHGKNILTWWAHFSIANSSFRAVSSTVLATILRDGVITDTWPWVFSSAARDRARWPSSPIRPNAVNCNQRDNVTGSQHSWRGDGPIAFRLKFKLLGRSSNINECGSSDVLEYSWCKWKLVWCRNMGYWFHASGRSEHFVYCEIKKIKRSIVNTLTVTHTMSILR